MNNVIDFINTNRDRYVEELKTFLAIPSISALPQHAADVKQCAAWAADEMRRIRWYTATGSERLALRRSFSMVTTTCSRLTR
jgi:hypothetical protein